MFDAGTIMPPVVGRHPGLMDGMMKSNQDVNIIAKTEVSLNLLLIR